MPKGPRIGDVRLPARFWAKIDAQDSGCWVWTASTIKDGYGQIGWRTKVVLAHRLSYEQLVSDIPIGLELDHLCRNTSCVNPSHLEPVTHAENVRRGAWAIHARGEKECRRGHSLGGDGTFVDGEGQKRCRECYETGWRARNIRNREVAIA